MLNTASMQEKEPGIAPRIRSFIQRQGRITPGQQQALDNYWEDYVLKPETAYDFSEVFLRNAPLYCEIGFGNGDSLIKMAAARPQHNFIGIEVHKPGVGRLMRELHKQNLTNVRIFCCDAIDVLQQAIADQSLSGIHLFFPDPWHKKKHHKRRIVQREFVSMITGKLLDQGYFHAATDWDNYAQHMLTILEQNPSLHNLNTPGQYCERPDYRPLTKFEQRGLRLGHPIRDIIYIKKGSAIDAS